MINTIPIFGWAIDFVLKASLSVPFWFIWTAQGLGAKYFYFLPEAYLTPGFWDCVGLFIVVPILKRILIPAFVQVNQSVEKAK